MKFSSRNSAKGSGKRLQFFAVFLPLVLMSAATFAQFPPSKDEQVRRLSHIRNRLFGIGEQVHSPMRFENNPCLFTVTTLDRQVFHFDFTRNSDSPKRVSGMSGVKVELMNSRYSLMIESEQSRGEAVDVLFFSLTNRVYIESVRADLDYYFASCQASE